MLHFHGMKEEKTKQNNPFFVEFSTIHSFPDKNCETLMFSPFGDHDSLAWFQEMKKKFISSVNLFCWLCFWFGIPMRSFCWSWMSSSFIYGWIYGSLTISIDQWFWKQSFTIVSICVFKDSRLQSLNNSVNR